MNQVVVTGGAGFIGSNIASHWLERGYRVVIYDNLGHHASIRNLNWLRSHARAESLLVLVGDVRRPTRDLEREIEAAEALFHTAGQVAVTASIVDPVTDFEVNAFGTFKLLELVRRSKGARPLFVYSSTNKVYGRMADVSVEEGEHRYSYPDFPQGIAEDRPLDFDSPYACSKGCADQYVRDYALLYDVPTVVFRQSCIYGYRQFSTEDQGWVAWFAIAALLNRPIKIFGNGKQVRDVLFIDDLMAAYELALRQSSRVSGQVFNIGGGPNNAVSLQDLLDFLRTDVNPDLSISYSDWRPADQLVYISNIGKARSVLGWIPSIDWKTGTRRLVDWLRENRSVIETMFSRPDLS